MQATFIHPSSVNNRRQEISDRSAVIGEKQLYAFAEKRQNVSTGTSNPQMNLITTTRLDPLSYMLFGAYKIEVVERGLECDEWLPVVGNLDALDDIQRLKTLIESCMLRVFEGITMAQRRHSRTPLPSMPREDSEFGEDEDDLIKKDLTLSPAEIQDLDCLTRDLVRILNHYNEERIASQSRHNSRPATPFDSPPIWSNRLPRGSQSGRSSPFSYGPPTFNSRPGTPSRFSRRI